MTRSKLSSTLAFIGLGIAFLAPVFTVLQLRIEIIAGTFLLGSLVCGIGALIQPKNP